MGHPLANMTFSASRIKTWSDCKRKAGWQYIAGYEDPGTGATDFGTEVHAELETIKREPGYLPNLMTDVGAVAAEALPHVSDFVVAGGDAKVEGEFHLRGRHRWRGFIDLRRPGHVTDYKTTGDFKWAKKPEDLLVDPQGILYAAHEFALGWAGDEVELRWLYLRKRRPFAARPVVARMTRAHALAGFAVLEAVADEFQAAAIAAPEAPHERHRYVLDVLPGNTNHCDAYGGCPHRSRCPSAPFFQAPSENTKGTQTMNILEKLEAMNALNGGAANAPMPRIEEPPMVGVPSPLAQAAPGAPLVFQTPPSALGGMTGFDPSWSMAPDAPPAEPPATEPSIPVAAVAAEPNAVNPPKRGPGRPPGAKNKKTLATPAPELAAATLAPDPTAASMLAALPTPAPVPAATPTFTPPAPVPAPAGTLIAALFVGCMPTRGTTAVDFDSLVAKAKVSIGPAKFFADYGYKSNGHLLQMIEAIVAYERPSVLVVRDSRTPEATLCLTYLRSVAAEVVEALR